MRQIPSDNVAMHMILYAHNMKKPLNTVFINEINLRLLQSSSTLEKAFCKEENTKCHVQNFFVFNNTYECTSNNVLLDQLFYYIMYYNLGMLRQ